MQPDNHQDTPTTERPLAEVPAAEANGSKVPDDTLRTGAGTAVEIQKDGTDPAPMNRVIDVPLTVTLRFGQRQLTLRELLELNTGSLVELDQQVEEPVHLMLGDRIIARGEVVIVDGNYGMRVLEVVEHSAARLAALGRV